MNKYELHITVDPKHSASQIIEADWDLEVLDIELDSGQHKKQVMVAWNIEAVSILDVCAEASYINKTFGAEFDITRIKLEGAPENTQDPKPLYYEAHWKLKRGTPMRGEGFRMPVLRSFNLSQPETEYWTIRADQTVKQNTFHACWRLITEWLEAREALIKKPHKELALIDTNIGLDAGWEEYRG